jgi:site-specific recombinase XerD
MTASKEICSRCGKARQIIYRDVCLKCREFASATAKLENIETSFKPVSAYNGYIFDLFLRYARRCVLRAGYVQQAEALKKILESHDLSVIQSWATIRDLSNTYKIFDKKYQNTGCVFKKIGRMLQELGVLAPSSEQGRSSQQLVTFLQKLNGADRANVDAFLNSLERRKRALRTMVVYAQVLGYFHEWCKSRNQESSLLLATHSEIQEYLIFLRESKRSARQVFSQFHQFNNFYTWLHQTKRILTNPCDKIAIDDPPRQIRVLAEEQLAAIRKFLKNPSSNPEDAFLIALILFFGMTIENLTFSQWRISNSGLFEVILRRKPLTFGRKYYNRDQVLPLPQSPEWFLNIQRSYYSFWLEQRKVIKKTFPADFIFVPRAASNWINKPLDQSVIQKRLKKATFAATGGLSISATTLRSTCGILYTRGEDASLLNKMGWSTSQSFTYVYLPKIFVNPEIEIVD